MPGPGRRKRSRPDLAGRSECNAGTGSHLSPRASRATRARRLDVSDVAAEDWMCGIAPERVCSLTQLTGTPVIRRSRPRCGAFRSRRRRLSQARRDAARLLVDAAREQAGVELHLELLLLVGAALAAGGERLSSAIGCHSSTSLAACSQLISPCQAARDQPSHDGRVPGGHAGPAAPVLPLPSYVLLVGAPRSSACVSVGGPRISAWLVPGDRVARVPG